LQQHVIGTFRPLSGRNGIIDIHARLMLPGCHLAHEAQHVGTGFGFFRLMRQRSGIIVVIPGACEVIEIEVEPARLAGSITEDRKQS
jgi:hypothetical protein